MLNIHNLPLLFFILILWYNAIKSNIYRGGIINLQKLRHLSCICAYCNKVMPTEERTNDHIIPRCSHGQTEVRNIVVCCQKCNSLKGNMLINDFLEKIPQKSRMFL